VGADRRTDREELPNRESLPVAGDIPLWVIATIPAAATPSLYRLHQSRQCRSGLCG
jgi:hypothetical protein